MESTQKATRKFLSTNKVKSFIREQYGRPVNSAFIEELNLFIEHKLNQAGNQHNGSKKTINREVAILIGLNKRNES